MQAILHHVMQVWKKHQPAWSSRFQWEANMKYKLSAVFSLMVIRKWHETISFLIQWHAVKSLLILLTRLPLVMQQHLKLPPLVRLSWSLASNSQQIWIFTLQLLFLTTVFKKRVTKVLTDLSAKRQKSYWNRNVVKEDCIVEFFWPHSLSQCSQIWSDVSL